MVNIRNLKQDDLPALRAIHERDYPDLEFPLERDLYSAFVIENGRGEIVMGGGVEPIAEALLVTDKTKSRIQIGKALVEAQRFCMYTCGRFKIRELHAFVTDDEYAKHLIQHGFQKREEAVLRIKL